MNSKKPRTPHQELEASLTALLLGELPADKAAALRELMVKDAELARLYERLEQTVGLVRETAAPSEQTLQSAPLKLSNKRREQLLAHFKTVAPKEFTKPERRKIAARELAVAAGLVAFIGIAAWLTFNLTQESLSSTSRVKAELGQRSQMVASYSRSSTPPPVADHSLAPVQSPTIYTASADGGGLRGIGSSWQTIFAAPSAGKPIANQVVLPVVRDSDINDNDLSLPTEPRKSSGPEISREIAFGNHSVQSALATPTESPLTLSVSTNSVPIAGTAGDPQWLGILERGSYSPSAYSSTNQFVSRSASIVVPTNTPELAEIASLPYQPRAPVLVTNSNADAAGFAYYLDLNRQGRFDTNGFSVDEMSRRQAGGLAWADNLHQKNGNLGLADDSVQQMSRSKLQEGFRNSSAPMEKVPVIDPATGLPVAGAFASGAIDPATGLPIPVEVVGAQEKMRTWFGAADSNAFFSAEDLSKRGASQAPYGGGGTGGGGGGGRAPAIASEHLPARTLREPALAPAQPPAATSPMAGERLGEVAQEGKEVSVTNIYLGREFAKADVKFGTWSLETGQPAAQPGGTKNEEERLKQVDEVRDGITIAGRTATPGLGFSLLGPKETPPSSVPIDSQGVPLLGDLPTLGKAFKGTEAKPGQMATEVGSLPGDVALARGTNATRDRELVTRQSMIDFDKDWLNPSREESLDSFRYSQASKPSATIRGDIAAIGGDVKLNADSPSLNWSFQAGASNRGRIEQAGEPK